jgi:hypothetical protein
MTISLDNAFDAACQLPRGWVLPMRLKWIAQMPASSTFIPPVGAETQSHLYGMGF